MVQVNKGFMPFEQRKNRYLSDGECCHIPHVIKSNFPPCFSLSLFHKELELHCKLEYVSVSMIGFF
jgi:hypothetical protein